MCDAEKNYQIVHSSFEPLISLDLISWSSIFKAKFHCYGRQEETASPVFCWEACVASFVAVASARRVLGEGGSCVTSTNNGCEGHFFTRGGNRD